MFYLYVIHFEPNYWCREWRHCGFRRFTVYPDTHVVFVRGKAHKMLMLLLHLNWGRNLHVLHMLYTNVLIKTRFPGTVYRMEKVIEYHWYMNMMTPHRPLPGFALLWSGTLHVLRTPGRAPQARKVEIPINPIRHICFLLSFPLFFSPFVSVLCASLWVLWRASMWRSMPLAVDGP